MAKNTKKSIERFNEKITKRGKGLESKKKEGALGVGPVVLGLLLFVVVGSAILQIINTR
jgi:hypothetical protein